MYICMYIYEQSLAPTANPALTRLLSLTAKRPVGQKKQTKESNTDMHTCTYMVAKVFKINVREHRSHARDGGLQQSVELHHIG